ncbi:MAG: TauD/TfdA family dioxygenase [Burkholderiales bacterium]|nr:TauD/TfdA family dioxygenase [Burkholderiales bacterium]
MQTFHPADGPATWTRASIGDFTYALDAAMRAELAAAVRTLDAAGRLADTAALGRDDIALPLLDPLLARAVAAVRDGCGVALLTGLPVDALTLAQFTAAAWAIGTRFGHALSQNARGQRITEVIDATAEDDTPRMYRSNLELRLHSDITAMIALACWQPAAAGGLSYLASAGAIHNAILARAPQLLEPLYRGFHYHRLGEEAPDMEPTTPYRTPVFALRAGRLSCRYQRAGIAGGHQARGVPLTDREIEALDLFDTVARAPENRIEFTLGRGDMMVVNNYAVLHARTGFTQHPEPARARRLVRLWLDAPGFRDVPPEFNLMAQNGVPAQPGRACTYDFKALYASDPRASGGVPRLEDATS